MNSRIFKGTLAVLTVAMLVMAGTAANAAVMTVSSTAPTVDGADIANLVTGTHNDKWWAEGGGGAGSAKGQSFLTGSDPVLLTSITYQIASTQKAMPTKTYTVRVGALSGTTISPFYSETATQDFNWNTTDGTTLNGEEYMTWTLNSPVFLSANSLYGIDIGLNSSTSNWQSGIPYIQYVRTNTYADGQRYTTGDGYGVGDAEAHLGGNDDRVFHLNLSTGPQAAYWDINGAAGGAGGATPTGTWDASANWNPLADGTGATAAWAAGQKAVFAAGGDATGAYTVTVAGTQDIGGLKFEEGTVTLSGGTALRMTTTTVMDVASGVTSTIATTISEDAAGRQLIKTGDGTLVLSGANSYTGPTTVLDGTLQVGAAGALPAVTDVTVGDLSGVESSTLDLDGNSVTVGTLTLVDNATVNTSGAATLTTSALTYNAGTLTLGTTALNADSLTANADLDVSSSTVSAPTAVTVNNSTLTVGHDIATQTLTLDGASIVGGAATADTKYAFTNIADYSADITGAAADLVIGEGGAADQKVKISGTGNTYGGITRLDSGYLEVTPDAGNLGSGQLVFNGGSLQTSGAFTGMLGASNDIKILGGGVRFAATDAPLTVTLDRADGTDGPLQFSYGSNSENGTGGSITLGSPTSDAMVELTNDLTGDHGAPGGGGQSYHVKIGTVDNPNSSNDIALVSGTITNPPTANQISFEHSGTGTLWLTGTNTGFARYSLGGGNQSVLRAVDGVGLSPTALLIFNGHVLESSGTFDRQIGSIVGNGVDPGQVDFNKEGGFSAYGGPLTVSLAPVGGAAGDPLTWNSRTLGFNSKSLYMGSPTANDVVTITNAIDGANGNRNIYVSGNPDSDADHVVFKGALTGFVGRTLYVRGTSSPGELRFNGSVTASNVRAETGAALGGNGTITGNLVITGTSIVAPGNGVGTLNVTGNSVLDNGSIYEWEVGQDGETDVLNITGGTLDMDNFVLSILDADGYVASATDMLPVFTYSGGASVDMGGFDNTAASFDTSALDDGMWDWSAGLALTDDAGTIYLTGLIGGASVEILWGGDATGNWATAEKWLPVGTPAGTSAAIVDTAGAVVSVAAEADARSLNVKQGTVDVQTGVVMNAGNSVTVDTAGTVNVDGTLNATAGSVAGTLGGSGTIDVDTIEVAATGTLNVDGTLNAATGSVAGTLVGSGTINVEPLEVSGILAPGGDGAVGTLTVGIGELALSAGSVSNVEVSVAAEVGDADGVTLTSDLSSLMLGGELNVSSANDRQSNDFWADAVRTIVDNTGGGSVGWFDQGSGEMQDNEFDTVTPALAAAGDPAPHIGQGAFLTGITYDRPGGNATRSVDLDVFVALGGDADGDGKVWLSDWAALRANFGNTGTGKT
ncbi:MAG: autotransporter-associated beta strand repeat-containing protein, partial [Candidatus Nealsonbacteria bacterium]|nr:autotransporter-associated beta strand repeat-containing protein [Candidatus Nealsonbacteria bacterium]